jgi:hypothetical protein
MAKGVKTGGRVKGSKNKHSYNAEEIAQRLGVNPLEILLQFAAGDWEGLGYDSSVTVAESQGGDKGTFIKYTITPELRASSADKACKYLFSAKQALDVMSDGKAIQINVIDYLKKDE